MRIRRLKLSGFKSFVEPAELRIEPGLTGIVGPNGCGKSNLLEAIRWVMGESSARSMRGGGMEDVIFAGTATRAARDFAEVTILVDGSTPDDTTEREIEVVRRIERGAGSAYRVNGRDVRAKDVGLLFADAATGAHSPALVSQGRIAAVIAAKPAERRMMLEEAAGIAGLHVRRKDAEQKLRATETNLTRLDELLGDMETRANALRRQARTAERYRTLSDAIRIGEARLIFARWREAAAAAEAARHEATLAGQLVEITAEAQRAAAAYQHQATLDLAKRRAAAEVARDAANALGHELAALRAERAAVDRRLGELAAQAETLARDRSREDSLAIDASAALSRLAEEDKALTGRLAGAEAALDQAVSAVRGAETAARDAEVELARAQADQSAEQAEIRVAQMAVTASRQRLDRADAEMRRIAGEAAAIGDSVPLIAKRDAAATARIDAETKVTISVAAIAAGEQEREAAAADRDAAQSRRATAQAGLAALESEMKALARALESAAAGSGVLALMRAEPGYERALAAALGDDVGAAVGQVGARRWTGGGALDGDPFLPSGVKRLADHVTAPPELARRLAQVGIVEKDDGSVILAAGQRLVTHDGRMRRWDGFIADNIGAAAAERLIRVNRLASLETQLPPVRDAVVRATAAQTLAGATLDRSKAAIDAARARMSAGEASARCARQEEDASTLAIERLSAKRDSLAESADRARANYKEAAAQDDQARAAAAALPDGAGTAARVEGLRRMNAAARDTLVTTRTQASALSQSIETDRRRQDAARAEAKGWRARAGDAAKRVAEMATRAQAVADETARLADSPARLEARIVGYTERSRLLTEAATEARAAEQAAEATIRSTERALADAGEALGTAREARAGAAARQENHQERRAEMSRVSGERFQCPAAVLPGKIGFTEQEVTGPAGESATLEKLTGDRERLGPVNLVAESELAELDDTRTKSVAERQELGEAINRLRGSIGSLNREGRARLTAAFEAVDGHFRHLFSTLFAGGEAHLALIDSDDPLEAGLEIMAQPPGKKLSALTLLSGGEQALTAVALIFALFLTNPAPICVLDEVDAPLDDANIERFCDLLDRMSCDTDTRYLIVTHNAVTMARMDRLFGVTMVERGISRLVSVDLGGAETLLAAE